jgi:hypothetical protein
VRGHAERVGSMVVARAARHVRLRRGHRLREPFGLSSRLNR